MEEQDDRLLAYSTLAIEEKDSISLNSFSAPSSAKGRLQGLGAGIIQRRHRMATTSALAEAEGEGVGLQSLSRSRMATSPLVNLIDPRTAGGSFSSSSVFLSKSVSFQNIPADLTTRYIDDEKIQKHLARSRGEFQTQKDRRQSAFEAATAFAKAMYWVTIFTGLFGIAVSGTVFFSASTSTWHKDFGKSPKFQHAAVASEQELCSRVGVGLLKSGGNAVDAAIGTLICIGVINNFSSGIGGGGFMLVRVNATYSTVLDYRETAPADVTAKDFGKDPLKLVEGGLSVAVPAQIKGLAEAHRRFGTLPWSQLFDPSIALCQQGFPVTAKLAKSIAKWAAHIERVPAMRETYMKPAESHDSQRQAIDRWVPKTESDIIMRPNLGSVLQQIATSGPEAFWKGPIADAIIAENKQAGGKLTQVDMENYRVLEREPLVGTFKGFKVTTVGAPASGAPLMLILRLLEELRISNATSIDDRHLFVEALKFGYAARVKIGDPDFHPEVKELEGSWLKEDNIKQVLKKIDREQTHQPEYYADEFGEIKDYGTTHLSVLDRDGMAVSVTDTVNLEFGSFIMDGQTGVLQNNEMGDFSLEGADNSYGLPPSERNFVKPGKRPVSSSTPIILERDGQVVLVTGAAGGSRIISCTAQVIADLLLFKMDPISAMIDSRIHHQLFPNEVIVDHETSAELIDGLGAKGHKVAVLPADFSLTSLQLILRRRNGEIWALSDPRKGGLADGY